MRKNYLRYIALAICIAMFVSILAACEEEKTPAETSGEVTTEKVEETQETTEEPTNETEETTAENVTTGELVSTDTEEATDDSEETTEEETTEEETTEEQTTEEATTEEQTTEEATTKKPPVTTEEVTTKAPDTGDNTEETDNKAAGVQKTEWTAQGIHDEVHGSYPSSIDDIRTLKTEADTTFVRYTGNDTWPRAEIVFARPEMAEGTALAKGHPILLNIGKCKYLSFLMRESDGGTCVPLLWIDGMGDAPMTQALIPTSEKNNEWDLIIIDLESLLGDDLVADENGDYLLQTFSFIFAMPQALKPAQNFDIQYIKFAETLDEIQAYSGARRAYFVDRDVDYPEDIVGRSIKLNVTASGNEYKPAGYSAQDINSANQNGSDLTIKSLVTEGDVSFIRWTGNNGWPAWDLVFAASAADRDNYYGGIVEPINMGVNKYIVMKVRGNTAPLMYLNGCGDETVKTFALPAATDDWSIIAIDVENILGEDLTNDIFGNNAIETFVLRFVLNRALQPGHQFDLQYIKYANTLDEIHEITGAYKATVVTAGGEEVVQNTNTNVIATETQLAEEPTTPEGGNGDGTNPGDGDGDGTTPGDGDGDGTNPGGEGTTPEV